MHVYKYIHVICLNVVLPHLGRFVKGTRCININPVFVDVGRRRCAATLPEWQMRISLRAC